METQTQKLIDHCNAEAAALRAVADSGDAPSHVSGRLTSGANLFAMLAAELRRLAANQLPEWASITPATDEPRAAQIVEGWASRWPGSVHAPRMTLAAAWIKSRDQEISTLRGQLSQAMPFPAFAEAQAMSQQIPANPARPVAYDLETDNLRNWGLGAHHEARVKCDGDHGGPACADPECWQHPEPSAPPTMDSLQSGLADLLSTMREDMQRRIDHDRAMLEQATRAADAQALRAMCIFDPADAISGPPIDRVRRARGLLASVIAGSMFK